MSRATDQSCSRVEPLRVVDSWAASSAVVRRHADGSMLVGRQMLQCFEEHICNMGFHRRCESSGRIYLLFGNSFYNRTVTTVAAEYEANFGQKLGLTPFRKPTKKPSENIQCFNASTLPSRLQIKFPTSSW